jgi:hypothetical protein
MKINFMISMSEQLTANVTSADSLNFMKFATEVEEFATPWQVPLSLYKLLENKVLYCGFTDRLSLRQSKNHEA